MSRKSVHSYTAFSTPPPQRPFADLTEPKDAAAHRDADQPLFKRQGDCSERHVERAEIDDRDLEQE